jgi:organic hydroperoxide reductase OsmC/OhrA
MTMTTEAKAYDFPLSVRWTRRNDGRFGFTQVVVHALVDTESGFEAEAAKVGEDAERGCLVAGSLDFPVRLELDVRTAPLVGAAL